MYLKRRILVDLYKNVELRKAVSMALYIKRYYVSSAVHNYSTNKLRTITGLSANVIKKHVNTLVVYGLAEFVGRKKDVFVLHTLKSSTKHRNIYIDDKDFAYDKKKNKNINAQKIKFIDDLVCIAMIVEIQKHKDYAKHIILQKMCPKNVKEFKEARSVCKDAGWGSQYVEKGLSYHGIAKNLGTGLQKAFLLIKKACEMKILRKINNIRKIYYQGAIYVQDMFKSYTYIYNNYVYKVYANSYVILNGNISL